MSAHKKLSGNFSFSLFAKLFYLITRIGMPPMVLAFVSVQEYGIWSIGFVVVSYLGLSTAGFSAVYVREAAQWARSGDYQRLNQVVSTGVSTLLVLGLVLSGLVWLAVPSVIDAFKIDPQYHDLARLSLIGCCWIFLVDMCLGASSWLLHGVGHFVKEQKVWVASYCLEVAVAAASLLMGYGIVSLLIAFAVRYVFSLSANAWLAKRAIPGLRFSLKNYRVDVLKRFMGYGAIVQVSSIFGTAFHSLDRVLAGLVAGPAATALFDLAGKLPSTAISIPSAINAATLPMAAGSEKDSQALRDIGVKASRWIVILLLFPLPFLSGFAAPVLAFWLGTDAEIAKLAPMMAVLAVAWHLHVLTGPVSAIARGAGQPMREYIYHGFRLVTYSIAAAWVLTHKDMPLPIMAACFALAVAVAAVAYELVSQNVLCGSAVAYTRKMLLPAVAGYPVAHVCGWLVAQVFGFGVAPSRLQAGIEVVAGGSLYAFAIALIGWMFILEHNEKQAIAGMLRRFSFLKVSKEVF